MVLTVDDDIGCAVFRVQCTFPNMESKAVLNRKTAKYMEKFRKKWGLLVMMLGGIFRVHCIFPYMEDKTVLNRKTAKKYRKNQKKMGMVGDDVGWCFQDPLYIFIYGR